MPDAPPPAPLGDREVGLAQVGIGYWGRNLFRNFSQIPNVAMWLACDAREEALAAVSRQYPGVTCTARYEDILESPDVDAVVVATETPAHFEMARGALEAGKHVFVEKPMAQSVAEAERLARLAESRGLHLMVGHLLMYHPAFRYVEDLIRSGGLGEVYYLYSQRVNLGIIRSRENAFESLAPHDLSVALQFLRSDPASVSASGSSYLQPGVEDVVFATVRFAGGKLAHLHTSWLDPHKVRKVTVVGTDRMAVIDDVESTEKVRVYEKAVAIDRDKIAYGNYAEAMAIRSGDIVIPKIDMREPLTLECRHFIDCLRTGEPPRSDGRNGLAVVRMLEAASRSLRRDGAASSV